MESKNITISEYLQDMTDMYDKLVEIYVNEILDKLKKGQKLSDMELYFLALQLDLIEDLKKWK